MKQQTLERNLLDLALAFLLLFSVGSGVQAVLHYNQSMEHKPTLEDMHQQQEMIDYHQSQGRNILVL